jgi:hypothetical protein
VVGAGVGGTVRNGASEQPELASNKTSVNVRTGRMGVTSAVIVGGPRPPDQGGGGGSLVGEEP